MNTSTFRSNEDDAVLGNSSTKGDLLDDIEALLQRDHEALFNEHLSEGLAPDEFGLPAFLAGLEPVVPDEPAASLIENNTTQLESRRLSKNMTTQRDPRRERFPEAALYDGLVERMAATGADYPFEAFPFLSNPEAPFFGCGFIESEGAAFGGSFARGEWLLRRGMKLTVEPWNALVATLSLSGEGYKVKLHDLRVAKRDRGQVLLTFSGDHKKSDLQSKIIGRGLLDIELKSDQFPSQLKIKVSVILEEDGSVGSIITDTLGNEGAGWLHAPPTYFTAGNRAANPDKFFHCGGQDRCRIDPNWARSRGGFCA